MLGRRADRRLFCGGAAEVGPGINTDRGRDIALLHSDTEAAAQAAIAAVDDKKGLGAVLLDVSELLVVTDVFLIVSGTSRRHVRTLAEEVEEALQPLGRRPLRREGVTDGTWVLIDFGDVVIHIFDEPTRAYYDLERLWGDAPRLTAAAGA